LKNNFKIQWNLVRHALILLIFQTFYFHTSWSLGLEKQIINGVSLYANNWANDDTSIQDSFIFINTEFDQQLVKSSNHPHSSGLAITNRALLQELFHYLSVYDNQEQFILCDILLDTSIREDRIFLDSLKPNSKLFFPLSPYYNSLVNFSGDTMFYPAGYDSYEGSVAKLEVYSQSKNLPSLPFRLYTKRHNYNFKDFFNMQEGYLLLNYFYPRYFINQSMLQKNTFTLSGFIEILKNNPLFYEDFVANRAILIGNKSTDSHFTSVGSLPGPIILYNSYLSITKGLHLIHWSWFIFALFSFYFILAISKQGTILSPTKFPNKKLRLLATLLSLTLITSAISLLSVFLFNVYVTTVLVLVYAGGVKFNRKYL
jgi:hypothetical protein